MSNPGASLSRLPPRSCRQRPSAQVLLLKFTDQPLFRLAGSDFNNLLHLQVCIAAASFSGVGAVMCEKDPPEKSFVCIRRSNFNFTIKGDQYPCSPDNLQINCCECATVMNECCMLRTNQNLEKEECLQVFSNSFAVLRACECVRVWCSRWRKEGAVRSDEAESGAEEIGRK